MKKMISTLLAALMTATLYVPAGAAVSAQEAEKLGTELTPLGADPKPNADGMIPAWTGGLPKKAVQGNRYEDPYAEVKDLVMRAIPFKVLDSQTEDDITR